MAQEEEFGVTFGYKGNVMPTDGVTDGVNLERAGLRVETMQTYAIVSSIIMGSSIGLLLGSLQLDVLSGDENESAVRKTIECIFVGFHVLSLVCSSYTTFIFTLMALYYSTALGLGGDECYQAFDTETQKMRMRAFNAFVTSVVLLMSSFVACVYLFIEGIGGKIMTAIFAILVALSFRDFNFVIKAAGRHIFAPLMKPKSKLGKAASQRILTG